MTVMMKCGHAANATDRKTGKPVCVICVGISPGATEIDDSPPDLLERRARCSYYGFGRCESEGPSSPELAFFEHKPEKDHDSFYCGCRGWN